MAAAMDQTGHKIFIGDLPADITQEELQVVFQTYGVVNNIVLLQQHAGVMHRCALLFYRDRQSGDDAISVLNGQYKIRENADRPIKVSWAREKGFGTPTTGMPGSIEPLKDADGYKLFVGNLPPDTNEEELRLVFSTYGQVNKIHVMGPAGGKGGQPTRVAAFVYYEACQSAEDGISVLHDKYKIRQDAESPIVVRWANPRMDQKGAGKGGCGGYDQAPAWAGGYNAAPAPASVPDPYGGYNQWGAGAGAGAGACAQDPKMRSPDGWKLFVGGLPNDIVEGELQSVFSSYGEVTKVHIMPASASGRVAAFVYYAAESAAEDSIKVLNNVYKIRVDAAEPIQVRWASEKGAGKGKGGFEAGKSQWAGNGAGGAGCGGGGAWAPWDSKGAGKVGMGWQPPQQQGWGNQPGNYGGFGGGGAWNGGDAKGAWNGGGKGFGKDPVSFEIEEQGKGDISETKLFVGNLPDDVTEDALKYIFGTYGTVKHVHIMTGKSRTGCACAFVELSTQQEADTAITTLHDQYEIKPGFGKFLVKRANAGRSTPY